METKYDIGEVVVVKNQIKLSSGTIVDYKFLFTIRSIFIGSKDIMYCDRENGVGRKIYEKNIVNIRGWVNREYMEKFNEKHNI